MLRYWQKFTQALLGEGHELVVALNAVGDDEALARRDIIHHEFLHETGIDITNVLLEAEARHAQTLHSVGSSQQRLGIVDEWVKLGEVVV